MLSIVRFFHYIEARAPKVNRLKCQLGSENTNLSVDFRQLIIRKMEEKGANLENGTTGSSRGVMHALRGNRGYITQQ